MTNIVQAKAAKGYHVSIFIISMSVNSFYFDCSSCSKKGCFSPLLSMPIVFPLSPLFSLCFPFCNFLPPCLSCWAVGYLFSSQWLRLPVCRCEQQCGGPTGIQLFSKRLWVLQRPGGRDTGFAVYCIPCNHSSTEQNPNCWPTAVPIHRQSCHHPNSTDFFDHSVTKDRITSSLLYASCQGISSHFFGHSVST